MRRRAALLLLALLSCRERPTFTCATSSQCGADGACIMGACAFPAADCSSGLRWDVSAPGRARACVEVPDMAMAAAADLAVGDMASAPPVDMVHTGAVAWSAFPNPAADAGTALRSVSSAGPNEAWAVGAKLTALHFVAGTWFTDSHAIGPFPPALDDFTFVVAAPPNGAWIFDGHPRALHLTDGSSDAWQTMQPRSQQTTIDGAALSAATLWMAGTSTGIMHVTPPGSPALVGGVDAITPPNFRAVSASPGGDVWVVGSGGVIVHVTGSGSTWTGSQIATTTTADLLAVWSDDANVWAVGAGGAVVHLVRNGSAWASAPSSTGVTAMLYGVWASASDDVWAVGDGGTIMHWTSDAIGWHPVASGTTQKLTAISGSGQRDIWAVGEGGVILHAE